MGTYAGTNGADRYTGGAGDDTIDGRAGNDILAGGGGNDLIIGGAGADVLTGGIGADTFRGTAAALNGDTITDFEAADTIIITDANLATFSFSLSGNKLTYTGGSITFSQSLAGAFTASAAASGGVQLKFGAGPPGGTPGNDILTGTIGSDQLNGLGGNDTIDGLAGADVLTGGDGKDSLKGGEGADTFRDTAYGLSGDTIVDFELGDRIVITDRTFDQNFYLQLTGNKLTYSGGELTFGSTASGTLVASAAEGGGVQLQLVANPVDPTQGTAGDDRLIGTTGNDQLSGLGGNDTLIGGEGADTLDGGDQGDWLYSGAESPTFKFPTQNSPAILPVLDTGAEVDSLLGGAGDDRLFAGYGDNVDGGTDGPSGYGDRLFISFLAAPSGITADFRLQTQVIGGGTITGIETISWIQGSNYDDNFNAATWYNVGGSDEGAAVFGMGGNDTIVAGASTVLVDGGDGNDILTVSASKHLVSVSGGAGNDTIYAFGSRGAAYGGDGNDNIYSALGKTYGGAGDDTISIQSQGLWAFGEDGNDHIIGATFADGGAGADVIEGAFGNSTFTGGADADVLTAYGQWDLFIDTMNGLNGDTVTEFGTGDRIVFTDATLALFTFSMAANTLTYGARSLTFGGPIVGEFVASAAPEGGVELHLVSDPVPGTKYGSSGDDTLNGTSSADRIDGLEGDDIIAGLSGADTLLGGRGNDLLSSGQISPHNDYEYFESPYPLPLLDTVAEVDTLIGGDGSDTFFAGYGDNVDGGPDGGAGLGDTLFISFLGASAGINADFRLDTQMIGGGTITGIETVRWVQGSNYDDHIILEDSSEDYFFGGAGYGMGGNDTLVAGYRTVFLDGGDGNDIVDGRYSYSLEEVKGGAGNDIVYSALWSPSVAYGGSGNDTIFALGAAYGEDGDDTLIGSDFDDQLDGGSGSDTLTGGELNDSEGFDTLTGGTGADTFRDTATGLNGDTITDLEAIDKIVITDANLATFTYSFSGSTLTYSGGSLTLGVPVSGTFVASAASGGGVQLQLASNPGIIGTPNNDTLNGKAGNDRIEGLAGNDKINGNAGADVLVGGLGADVLIGGAGSDSFVYSASAESTKTSMDQIKGFEKIDVIDLSLIDAISATDANDAFSYIGTQAFHHIAGELRVYRSQLDFFVEGDTNGDGIADLSILLTSTAGLGVDQFLL